MHKLHALAFCVSGLAGLHPVHSIGSSGLGAEHAADRQAAKTDVHLITASGMGAVRLDMTLDEARRTVKTASFARASDGDGAALVEVTFGKEDALILWAGEDEAAAPVDWSKKIISIETFSPAFHTTEGVHPGSLVRDVIQVFGPVREITESEIESRQYITFERQPQPLTFRLDYTGIFAAGTRRTTRFSPDAKILSIAIHRN